MRSGDPPARCGARTRRGTACAAKALANGRCRNHGGHSTGPRTPEGWGRVTAGYRAYVERRRSARLAEDPSVDDAAAANTFAVVLNGPANLPAKPRLTP